MERWDEDDGPAVRRVKLMADYSAFPLWAEPSGDLREDPSWFGMLGPEDLPLSPALVAQLWSWVGRFEELATTGFRWRSGNRAAFVADGRRLRTRVQEELGPRYEVVHFNETTLRVEER